MSREFSNFDSIPGNTGNGTNLNDISELRRREEEDLEPEPFEDIWEENTFVVPAGINSSNVSINSQEAK